VSGSVAVDSESGCNSDSLIEEWVQELENDEDANEDADADIDESESIGGKSQEDVKTNISNSIYDTLAGNHDDKVDQDLSQYSWPINICSISMDYGESSIHPDVIQYRVCDLLFCISIGLLTNMNRILDSNLILLHQTK
jgi:hypothetical protein